MNTFLIDIGNRIGRELLDIPVYHKLRNFGSLEMVIQDKRFPPPLIYRLRISYHSKNVSTDPKLHSNLNTIATVNFKRKLIMAGKI